MSLQEYRRKRHFNSTPEPSGEVAPRRNSQLSFVVQKHAASHLHYDFRLELDGVLKSWAVPKGPALDPQEKRLAVEVEDHPLAYATFEGQIPAGQYGAGEVIVWDRGFWTPLVDPHQGLQQGNLKFHLEGKKLHGDWALVRLKRRRPGDKENWLLMKKQDAEARSLDEFDITLVAPESVKSGRRLGEPAGPSKSNNRARSVTDKQPVIVASKVGRTKRGASIKAPAKIDVQLATLVDKPPRGEAWIHEVKFDGYRMLCYIESGKVRLITRNQQDWTKRYQRIVDAAAALDVESAILDGEVVALLPSGVTSFQALQNVGKQGALVQLAYYAFDLLFLDGTDLRNRPLLERKQQLQRLITHSESSAVLYSEHFATTGDTLLEHSCKLGLEGIISKRADRPYSSGRSHEWLKSKCLGREELVIGGFTLSAVKKRGIGALLVGYFNSDKFIYAGRVGTGFNEKILGNLQARLEKLRQKACPFKSVPPKERRPNVRWVRPELVAEIAFTGWTESGVLRHPSFQGLREDKSAAEVSSPASLLLAASNDAMTPKAKAKQPVYSTAKQSRTKPNLSLPQHIEVELTNPDRVLFDEIGLTKLGLASYYAHVSEWILPYIVDRPLSMVRCPEGGSKKCFYQKHATVGTPKSLGRVEIQEKEEIDEYLYVKDLDGLLGLTQISILEIHPWGSRRDAIDKPDYFIFDLDPDPSVPWQQVVDGALIVRELLSEYDLQSFVKTTGGKGLHVVAPLKPRRATWQEVKAFARAVGERIVASAPRHYTLNMAKAARKGKIFIDYLRNDRGSTAIAPYSTRAKPSGPVSVPVEWEELTGELRSDSYDVVTVLDRLNSLARDPWDGFFEIKQTLPKSPKKRAK